MGTQEIVQKAQTKGFTLRQALPKDAPAVKNVAIAAYPNPPGWENSVDDCIHYTNLAGSSGTLDCMVMEKADDGSIVGYIFFKMKGNDVYVSDTAVSPAMQGQKLGVLLMAYVLAWGEEKNLTRVTLYTTKDSKGKQMQTIYRNIGFKMKKFDYTTDDDEGDKGSYPMTVPVETANKQIIHKI